MKSKEQKREEANERQSASRSAEDQLKYLDKKGFVAVKERAKIAAKLQAAADKAVNNPPKKKAKKTKAE